MTFLKDSASNKKVLTLKWTFTSSRMPSICRHWKWIDCFPQVKALEGHFWKCLRIQGGTCCRANMENGRKPQYQQSHTSPTAGRLQPGFKPASSLQRDSLTVILLWTETSGWIRSDRSFILVQNHASSLFYSPQVSVQLSGVIVQGNWQRLLQHSANLKCLQSNIFNIFPFG